MTVLLVDHAKFAASGPVRICGLERLDALITDREPPAEMRGALARANVRVVVSDGDG